MRTGFTSGHTEAHFLTLAYMSLEGEVRTGWGWGRKVGRGLGVDREVGIGTKGQLEC